MPIDYKKYPENWKEISRFIRFKRANNRCETCGVYNGLIFRWYNGKRVTPSAQEWEMIYSKIEYGGYNFSQSIKLHGYSRVVLTVAHIAHDLTNNKYNPDFYSADDKENNLVAECQSCHLGRDKNLHVMNRKYGNRNDNYELGFNSKAIIL
jgi:hypothetical protein